MRKLIIAAAILVMLGLACVAPASAQYIDYYGQMSYSNRYPLPLPGNPANPYLNWPSGGPYYGNYYAPYYGSYYAPYYGSYYRPYYGINYGYGPYSYAPRYYYPYSYGYSMYQPSGGIYYYRSY